MNILGINAFHGDSSAALVVDGKLIAAIEEERLKRIKHWAGFPEKSIEYCLKEAGLTLSDIDVIAINQDGSANLLKKITFALKNKPDLKLIFNKLRTRKERQSIEQYLQHCFPEEVFKGEIQYIEHHQAHLSSAFHVSPFDEAVVVSVDGFGDFSSAAWGTGRGNKIDVLNRVYFPHSLGIFYQAMTQFLGFPHYGDEYKVMGLAPYGKPTMLDKMRKIVSLKDDGSFELNLKYFIHQKEKIAMNWKDGAPEFVKLYTEHLQELLGSERSPEEKLEQKHYDLARSIQAMYEEAFFHLLNTLHKKTGLDNLALSGGCAMNSVANGKVYRNTPFKKVYIQSAAGDAGGAIGSAFSSWFSKKPAESKSFVMEHAYYGPSFDNDYIGNLLRLRQSDLQAEQCSFELFADQSQLYEHTAQAISEGKVIGWFQGRMEWGPRALGNRSILGDPRRNDMKDILNLKIKRRESFRPFAPSILREYVADWFEEDDEVPFMMKVFQIKSEKREQIPAVTHVDGSGRLQTVFQDTNPRYFSLINRFYEKTGVPMLLNTSFNENEPVVCKPEEALDCFLRTKMDVLVMQDYFIFRSG